MTNIDSILQAVAPQAVRPGARVVEADLARGRAALAASRRRRRARGLPFAAGAVAAAGVAVAFASSPPSHSGDAARSAGAPRTASASRSAPRVHLVAFSGTQLPGFTVKQIPAGWHLSTSTSTALLITRDGSTNHDPDDFVDKLAVLPQSTDEHGLGPGDPVTVNGRPGRFDNTEGPGGPILRYTTVAGHAVDIQAPSALHWSAQQLVAFAQGVTVTPAVGVTHG